MRTETVSKIWELLLTATVFGFASFLVCFINHPERKHQCLVPFRDYFPDPIASQKYLGLDPDGLPYEDFGRKWNVGWLDQTGYDLIVEFGGGDE